MEYWINKERPIDRKEEGFTIIEVLLAMMILSIALLGMAALTVGIINGNTHSKEFDASTPFLYTNLTMEGCPSGRW